MSRWDDPLPSEYADAAALTANVTMLQRYQTLDRAGKGHCRRCDRQGFLNEKGYCSKACQEGQVSLPYQR